MKVVELVSMEHWRHKLDRCRWLACAPLQPEYTGNGFPGYIEGESVYSNLRRLFGDLPDIVLAYKPLDHVGFDELPCITCIRYNEIKPDRWREEIAGARPKLAVFHHWNDLQDYGAECPGEAAYIPHVADPAIFLPQGEKSIDVLLVGALSGKIYPLRSKFRRVMQLLSDYRCEVYWHPGYMIEHAETCDHLRDFAAAVASARIACFCSSIYSYRFGKYAEVPACGTVMAADLPRVAPDDQLEGSLLRCELSQSEGHIAGILRSALESDLAQRTAAGLEYAAQFTPAFYSEQLLSLLERI